MRPVRAFSLVEMLVVLAIIAVLVALVLCDWELPPPQWA